MGYSERVPAGEAIMKAEKFWEKHGIKKGNKEFIACFLGTLGRQFELETVIEAARKLKAGKRSFRFVLCGSGDKLAYYKNLAKDCEDVVFPGWVGVAEIWTLMRIASVGLAPYVNSSNFIMNLPNKPVEYISAGLPIVSSLGGVLKNLLSTHNCGVTYENGDTEGLVSILINLYDNRDLLGIMSENAYSLYKENFVAEKVYGDMIDYLESVCENFKKAGRSNF